MRMAGGEAAPRPGDEVTDGENSPVGKDQKKVGQKRTMEGNEVDLRSGQQTQADAEQVSPRTMSRL